VLAHAATANGSMRKRNLTAACYRRRDESVRRLRRAHMLDKDFVFVLGAQDPEMREIAHVLRMTKRGYVHAAKERMRVSSRTAYDADGVVKLVRGGRATGAVLPPRDPAVFVECTVRGHVPLLRVDHHHPGDPGYPMPPQRYVEGASIGQTLALLEMEPTPTQRLLAAADHCLTAAYQGQCPQVDPNGHAP